MPFLEAVVTGRISVGVGNGIVAVFVGSAADDRIRRGQRVVATVLDHRKKAGRSHYRSKALHRRRDRVWRDVPFRNGNHVGFGHRGGALACIGIGNAPVVRASAGGEVCGNRDTQHGVVGTRNTDIAHGLHRCTIEIPYHIIDTVDMLDIRCEYRIRSSAARRVAA